MFVCSFWRDQEKKSPLQANYGPCLAASAGKGSLASDLRKEKGPKSCLPWPCVQSEVPFHDGSSIFFLNRKDPDVGFPSAKQEPR